MPSVAILFITFFTIIIGLVAGRITRILLKSSEINNAIDKLSEIERQIKRIREMREPEKAAKRLRLLNAEYKKYRSIISKALFLRAMIVFAAFMFASILMLVKMPIVKIPIFYPLVMYIAEVSMDSNTIEIGITSSSYIVFLAFILVLPLIQRLSGIKNIER